MYPLFSQTRAPCALMCPAVAYLEISLPLSTPAQLSETTWVPRSYTATSLLAWWKVWTLIKRISISTLRGRGVGKCGKGTPQILYRMHCRQPAMNGFPLRYEIAQLLQHLWLRPDCRESILGVCGCKKFEVGPLYTPPSNLLTLLCE